MQKRRVEIITRILQALAEGRLSPETADLVRGWILGKDDRRLKDRISMGIFDRKVKAASIPDRNTRKSLKEVHRRLNFPETRPIRVRLRPAISVAAVLAVAITLSGVLWFNNRTAEIVSPAGIAQVSVVVPADSSRTVTLPDGSIVELAQGAEFTYNEDFLSDRTAHLNGEAKFKVAKLDGKTFTVNSSSITVTVLGTEFHMKSHKDDFTAEVKLASGKVSVVAEGIEDTTMDPGQHFVYNKRHKTIDILEIGEKELMRLRGMNMYFDDSLNDIFDSLSQRYNKRLVILDQIDLNRELVLPLDGTETMEEVLTMMKALTGDLFEYKFEGDSVIIAKPE